LGFTKPLVSVDAGCPTFKTQKLLGGRALVSDTFSKAIYTYSDPWPPLPRPGYGQYAHRDGYNVLYGDWSAKWYGDPQGTILWENTTTPAYFTMGFAFQSPSYSGIAPIVPLLPAGATPWSNMDMAPGGEEGSAWIWHLLDLAAGADVDAKHP
jgi:hypothetical protein